MPDILELPRRLVGGAPEIGDAAHTETREPAVAGREWNIGQAYRGGQILVSIELQPLAAKPRVAGAEFVDHVRRENVGFVEYRLTGIVGPVARREGGGRDWRRDRGRRCQDLVGHAE